MLTYTTVCSSRDRAAWLAARRTGIGASEIAAVLGISPWKSRWALWADKRGLVADSDLAAEREAVAWGNLLETAVAEEWARRADTTVTMRGQLLRSVAHPWAIATLDATFQPDGILEVKTTGGLRADDWLDGPPPHYELQVQQQLLVTGAERAAIACLIGGQKLAWAWVERDERAIRQIVSAGAAFWELVQSAVPPETDGSESTARALAEAFATDDGATVELAPELRDACESIAALKSQRREVEAAIAERENALKAALGPHQRGALPGGWSVSWKTQQWSRPASTGQSRVLRLHAPKER